jgi:hypothetical protein
MDRAAGLTCPLRGGCCGFGKSATSFLQRLVRGARAAVVPLLAVALLKTRVAKT